MRKEYKVEIGTQDIYCYGNTRQEAYNNLPVNLKVQLTSERLQLTESSNLELYVSKHQSEVDDG